MYMDVCKHAHKVVNMYVCTSVLTDAVTRIKDVLVNVNSVLIIPDK